ncbi:MAG: hypothetical protein QOI75_3746 [Pseudonocardiales bacterium]|jgi:hypothetical protein|nr:hypothetical protein [Pseudonocardiales bacterium]
MTIVTTSHAEFKRSGKWLGGRTVGSLRLWRGHTPRLPGLRDCVGWPGAAGQPDGRRV